MSRGARKPSARPGRTDRGRRARRVRTQHTARYRAPAPRSPAHRFGARRSLPSHPRPRLLRYRRGRHGSLALPSVHRFRRSFVLRLDPQRRCSASTASPSGSRSTSAAAFLLPWSGFPARPGEDHARASAPRTRVVRGQVPLQRITVNFAPGNVRKTGAGLELAVALGLMLAESLLPKVASTAWACWSELGLDGSVRPVPGTLVLAGAPATDGSDRDAHRSDRQRDRGPLFPGVKVRAHARWPSCGVSQGRVEWPEPEHRSSDPDVDDVFSSSRSTSSTCAASRRRGSHSRSRPRVRTTSCWRDRRVPARRCSPAGSRRSSRRSIPTKPSR